MVCSGSCHNQSVCSPLDGHCPGGCVEGYQLPTCHTGMIISSHMYCVVLYVFTTVPKLRPQVYNLVNTFLEELLIMIRF
jgi:hypothetical protein